jgi:hypothetical protein
MFLGVMLVEDAILATEIPQLLERISKELHCSPPRNESSGSGMASANTLTCAPFAVSALLHKVTTCSYLSFERPQREPDTGSSGLANAMITVLPCKGVKSVFVRDIQDEVVGKLAHSN